MSDSFDDPFDRTAQGGYAPANTMLPHGLRLQAHSREKPVDEYILANLKWFESITDLLMKNPRYVYHGKTLRTLTIPDIMLKYLIFFDDVDVTLQAEGCGPSVWATHKHKTTIADFMRAPSAETETRGLSGETEETSGKRRAPSSPYSSSSSSSSETAADASLMSPPSKAPAAPLTSEMSASDYRSQIKMLEAQVALLQKKPERSRIQEAKERLSEKTASNYIAGIAETISFVRANIDGAFLYVLDNMRDYVNIESGYDIIAWWNMLLEKTLFSVLDKAKFAKTFRATLIASQYYNYEASGVDFSVLCARYITAFRVLRLADDRATEKEMVDILVDNLPATPGFRESRMKLRSNSLDSPSATAARSSLSLAIQLFTDGLYLVQSLEHVQLNFARSSIPLKEAPKTTSFEASILHMHDRLTQIEAMRTEHGGAKAGTGSGATGGGNDRGRKSVEPVYSHVCKFSPNFGKCDFGDNCKFMHSSAGKPDHRLDPKGVMKNKFLSRLGSRPRVKPDKSHAKPDESDKDKEIAQMQKQMQKQQKQLKILSASIKEKSLFGLGDDDDEDDM